MSMSFAEEETGSSSSGDGGSGDSASRSGSSSTKSSKGSGSSGSKSGKSGGSCSCDMPTMCPPPDECICEEGLFFWSEQTNECVRLDCDDDVFVGITYESGETCCQGDTDCVIIDQCVGTPVTPSPTPGVTPGSTPTVSTEATAPPTLPDRSSASSASSEDELKL